MSIGTSLNLHDMLTFSLEIMLKKLDCLAGGIHLWQDGLKASPVFALPDTAPRLHTYQAALTELVNRVQDTPANILAFPIHGRREQNTHFYIFDLSDVGFLTLIKAEQPLEEIYVTSFQPLQNKLATAVKACLQNEGLMEAYSKVATYNTELIKTSRQLEASRQELQYTLAELRQVASKNQAILNTIPDSLLYLNSHGDILDFKDVDNFLTLVINSNPDRLARPTPSSSTVQPAFGQHPSNSNFLSLLPADAAQLFRDNIQRTLSTGNRQTFDFELTTRTNRRIFETRLVVSGRDEVLSIIRDITELKQAGEALRQSEERLRSTVDSMDDLIIVLNKAGYFIDYYQPLSRPELYIPPEDFLYAHFENVLPPDVTAKLARAAKQVADTGTVQQFDYQLQMDDGELWFNAKVSARRDNNGQFDGVTVVVRDVTERYELDKLRDDFVSTVTHELRTPLASIMGWTETLLTENPGPLTDRQRRFLTIVEENSNRLNKLVEEILTVSRIQRGALKLDKAPFSPTEAVSSVETMIVTLAARKDITLVVNNTWPAAQQLTGDKNRLEQVIINLLTNAIKFTPEGGQVWLHSTQKANTWRVKVQDTGIGIPKADIPRLFDRFYRASNATTAKIQGTGLGLYICKAIVEAHGGQIQIESNEGHGTSVQFTVPTD